MYILKRAALMSNNAVDLGFIISLDSWEECYLDFIHADMNKIKRHDIIPNRTSECCIRMGRRGHLKALDKIC